MYPPLFSLVVRSFAQPVNPIPNRAMNLSLDFRQFDTRHYPTVPARTGYGEWVSTYEKTVLDEMDLRLLDRLTTVPWREVRRAAELGCGTGRTGAWLKRAGVREIDAIDITPEMLAVAEAKGVYATLAVRDVLDSGFGDAGHDLAIASLVDEHIRDLKPFYREAARVIGPGGRFVIVGYHPQFIMASGMPTHFHRAGGEPVAIETHVHLLSHHFKAARRAGLSLIEMEEGAIDEAWVAKKPTWGRFRGQPISFAFVWRKGLESPAK